MGIRPSYLALAGLLAAPAAQAIDYEFSGDLDVRGFGRTQADGGYQNGFEQRIRLRTDIALDDGVSLHAGVNLINDTWRGDASGDVSALAQTQPFTWGRDHRTVTLDYGYVQVPLGDWTLRAGRQIANWNFGMTVGDDRRDRILLMRPAGEGVTFLMGGDQRQKGTLEDNKDDGYLVFAGFVGKTSGWSWGALLGHYMGDDETLPDGTYELGRFYAPRDGTLVSPWAKGQLGAVEVTAGGHYLGGGDAVFTNDTFGGFLRGGMDATEDLKLDAQYFFSLGGSLIETGFDTFSSMIHSNPRHNATSTYIPALSLSGLGDVSREFEDAGVADQDFDRHLVATRGTYSLSDEWSLKLAAGWVRYDGVAGDLGKEEDVTFGDLQMHYQVTPSTRIWATYGYADTADLVARDSLNAFSVNLRTQF
ncbi:hypothetical protein [Ectothiorhodospira mobilis]|uniref:hypothetical protein n=1 Tax=Ectothiorhodospira mobilis TaxID=195064 RepID=UPI001EE7FEC7|nr:hypothetical protein [Ectothiorhodospira mobilis]MCG5534724.1 hypothetical protein [Ectothiorhodospira mobilis]